MHIILNIKTITSIISIIKYSNTYALAKGSREIANELGARCDLSLI